ncbi:unnamed protein product [Calypogeia fissa]
MASPAGSRHDSGDVEAGSDSGRSSKTSDSSKGMLGVRDPFTASGAEGRSRREDDEEGLKWAAWARLPSYDRLRTTVLGRDNSKGETVFEQVDVLSTGADENEAFLGKAFKRGPDVDNEDFLVKIRKRLERVDLKLPTVEVRYENLTLSAACRVGDRFLPTLPNTFFNSINDFLGIFNMSFVKQRYITILHDVSGIIKPGRMTLLLGPPSSGRTSLLLALAASLEHSVTQTGTITYNGHTFDEFKPLKTAAYINQSDLHSGEFTVRETLDYASRYQGVGTRFDMLTELLKREKELGIHPDSDVDYYMTATALEGVSHDLVTDYIIKILRLEVCKDTLIGDEMRRGVSGGQKKRVTIGELLVGPWRTYFMDEVTNGLDSSTACRILTCLGQFCHVMEMTMLITLLQPAPEIFELFDDIILLSDGQIVYHGPRENVEEFFVSCGFRCPPRKGLADFLQEVTSRKDQEQYWADKSKPYQYVSVTAFGRAFKDFHVGQKLQEDLATPFDKSKSLKGALTLQEWSLSQYDYVRITFQKEVLFLKRNSFIYIFKTFQMFVQGLILATVFFRTRMHRHTYRDAQVWNGAIFANSITVMFTGFADVTLTVVRLPFFYKLRDKRMFPAWAFALATLMTRIPFSLIEATVFVALTYYPMGFAPNAGRFFKVLLIYIVGHQMASSMFRAIAGWCRTMIVANSLGSLVLTMVYCLGGFIIPRSRFKPWWIWGYWIDPLSWSLIGVSETEFLAPQWANRYIPGYKQTLGKAHLHLAGYYPHSYWYWVSVSMIVFQIFVYNFLFVTALTYIRAPGRPQPVISEEALAESEENRTGLIEKSEFLLTRSATKDSSAQRPSLDPGGPSGSTSMTAEGKGKEEVQQTTSHLTPQLSSTSGRSLEKSARFRKTGVSMEVEGIAGVPAKHGMVLPFQPLTISFNNICYYVDMPSEMRQRGATEDKLQLLKDITSAFRPGILTALVGVTGAGKSTLMDVLLGRKTKGTVTGDIYISGYPKKQDTFARVSGYCEQNDIHSPQITVRESLIFSAFLRLSPDVGNEQKEQFIDEVMDLVELTNLRNSIVGLPSVSGLSTEQRKRLTIAVELVANPSIIFMDEPTSGLDARAAAIVMRAVRNTVDTGRTVVCTIHQPSIDIFESFDELLLLKLGGQAIYAGPLGRESKHLIDYFEAIPGVPPIKDRSNPATWMLEITTSDMERKLGIDFAEHYTHSDLYQQIDALADALSKPLAGTEDLHFPTKYAQPPIRQLSSCVWKQNLTYWRTPEYNNVRYFFTFFSALLFGTMFLHVGQKRSSHFNVLEVMGAIYASSILIGIIMSTTVQPMIGTERAVFYREHAAGLYSPTPYALSQVLVEIPYTFVQALIYSLVTYSLINLEWKADKFFLYLHFTFCVTILFIYYGMMTVALSPNVQVATVLSAFFFNVWNIFSGFIIAKPRMPVWWSWYYWACPLAWHIYGSVIAQFGDLNDKLIRVVGEPEMMSIPHYLKTAFGFRHKWLGYSVAMTVMFPTLFAVVYILAIKTINFQQR